MPSRVGNRAPPPDLGDLVPIRCVDCEPRYGGLVTLLRPKFPSGLLGRWLQPHLRRPCYRVHLDEIGSAVWEFADGSRTVREVAAEIERRFGNRVVPALQRVGTFVRELNRGEMMRLMDPR